MYHLLVLKIPRYPPSSSLLQWRYGQPKNPSKVACPSFLLFISEHFLLPCTAGYQMIFLLVFEFQLYVITPYIKSGTHFYSKPQLSSVLHLCFDKTKVITFSSFSAWLLGLHDLHRYLSAKLKKPLCLLLENHLHCCFLRWLTGNRITLRLQHCLLCLIKFVYRWRYYIQAALRYIISRDLWMLFTHREAFCTC